MPGRNATPFLVLLAFLTASLMALAMDELGEDYIHRVWTGRDGLPNEKITSMCRTRDGHLWLGTENGIVRMDGLEVKVLSRTDYPWMGSGKVFSVAEDDHGKTWGLGEDFLFRWDGRQAEGIAKGTLGFRGFHCLYPSKDGVLAVNTSGIHYVTLAGIRAVPGTNAAINEASNVVEAGDGTVWWGGQRLCWFHRDTAEWSVADFPREGFAPESTLQITGFHPHPEGGWIAVVMRLDAPYGIRLWHFDGSSRWTPLTGTLREQDSLRYFSFMDRHQRLWMPGGNATMLRFSFGILPASTNHTPGDRLLTPVHVSQLSLTWRNDHPVCGIVDIDDNLWLGSAQGTLHQFKPKPLRTFGNSGDVRSSDVRCILPGKKGSLWVGTDDGLALWGPVDNRDAEAMDTASLEQGVPSLRLERTFRAELVSERIRALAATTEGDLWVGTMRGLSVIQDGSVTQLRFQPHVKTDDLDAAGWNKCRVIVPDGSGAIWIGVPAGLHRIRGNQDLFLTSRKAEQRDVRAILSARDGAIWVGFDGQGLLRLPPRLAFKQNWEDADLEGTPFDAVIVSVLPHRFPRGRSFVTPRSTPERPRTLTAATGLSSSHVRSIQEDADGVVWVGTENGINRVLVSSPSAEDDVGLKVSRFDGHAGFPTRNLNSLLVDDGGNLWAGHDHGIFRVKLAELNQLARGKAGSVHCTHYGINEGMDIEETSGVLSSPAAAKGAHGVVWFATPRGFVRTQTDHPHLEPRLQPSVSVRLVRANDSLAWGEGVPGAGAEIRLPPGTARVLEFHYMAPDFDQPGATRYRYRLEGYEDNWHEAGTRRVAFYTNLRPGGYRFRVEAAHARNGALGTGTQVAFVIEPYYWQTQWFWALTGLTVLGSIGALLSWRIRLLRQHEEARHELARARERESMARDLHDGLGSSLTSMALLADPGAADPRVRLGQLAEAANEAIHSIKEILRCSDGRTGSLEDLLSQICETATQAAETRNMGCFFDIPLNLPSAEVEAETRRHVYFAAREAVTNALKHSGGTKLQIRVRLMTEAATLQISDNGQGMRGLPERGAPDQTAVQGHGLTNMQTRMKSIGGSAHVRSSPELGTTVELQFPVVPNMQ